MNIKKVLDDFSKVKIAVVGDIMLDSYIYGAVERISPVAPVPVVRVEKEIYELGGAANVAANITSLRGNTFLFGYIGIANVEEQTLSQVEQLTTPSLGFEKAGEAYFSPDGKMISFQAVLKGEANYQIFTMNLNTKEILQISKDAGACTC